MSKRYVSVPLDFKLVARIGLSVAVAAFLGLLLVLIPFGDEKATGYRQIVGAFVLAKQSLGPAMLAFGLTMVGFASIVAWLFSIYASFRIAGPLYRISRNLEKQIEQGPVVPIPVRTTDSLQSEWKAFEASVSVLREQHEELRLALNEVENALRENTRSGGVAALGLAMTRLKQAERRVHL